MPSRILRDWTDSEPINSLSANAERLFVRLLMKADDYGRYTANPKLVRAQCFPLLIDTIREADVSRWIAECEKAGMIALYEVDAKPLLEIIKFGQRLRNSRAKYPARGELRQVAASCGELRPDSESEAHSESESESESEITPLPPQAGAGEKVPRKKKRRSAEERFADRVLETLP